VSADVHAHPFARRPHKTVLKLTGPVLLALVAEPLTGLIDTAFVSRLGSEPLAALGAATTFLSALFWLFGFLGVSTQTEVAQALGRGDEERARATCGVGLCLAMGCGLVAIAGLWPQSARVAQWMGADAVTAPYVASYFSIRLLSAPAVILVFVVFGALRGVQDMWTPLRISVAMHAVNLVLDPILIWGIGPLPALGVAGAAWASVVAQWLGAVWGFAALARRRALFSVGAFRFDLAVARRLVVVGRDMLVRTAGLSLFLILATRQATQVGPQTGAAHQVIRQVWTLTALLLDGFAATAQSLVGYFIGAGSVALARRVAWVTTLWAVAVGALLTVGMWVLGAATGRLLVPSEALAVFGLPWVVSALFQPFNAVSFVTDGIHWGSGDYGYLRNGMLLATAFGVAALYAFEGRTSEPLVGIWLATGVWITVRSCIGVLRVWPGGRRAPLGRAGAADDAV
jgi:MATE family multidrug resistance protein